MLLLLTASYALLMGECSRPSGVTPLTTVTRTATVTLSGDENEAEVDGVLRVFTETVTMTEAVAIEYTFTERVTVTQPAVIPVPITRTTLSTSTSTSTIQQASQRVDNGQARQDASPAQETGIPFDYTCRPGDANEKYAGGPSLEATDNQRVTLCELLHSVSHELPATMADSVPQDLIGIYIISILVAWNLIGFRTLLYPVKMLVVAYHEFWHILVGVCLGQKLEKVDLAPELGGKTVFNAPELPEISFQPYACYFVGPMFDIRKKLIGRCLIYALHGFPPNGFNSHWTHPCVMGN